MVAVSPVGRTLARSGFAPLADIADTARTSEPAVLPLRRVLAITDLSASGTNAAWRAGLVARDRGVPLQLLSVQSALSAVPEAQAALEQLARELRERLRIAASAQAIHGKLLREGAQAVRNAGLLVIAAVRANPLGEWVLGTRAERLARHCRTPVLVVRRPAFTSYRNVIVPVKLEPEACGLIAAARAFSRDPRMKVLHVLCTHHEEIMRRADVPEAVIYSERNKAAERSRRLLADLIASAGAQEDGAVPAISFGPAPTRVLDKEVTTCAELLVLGTQPRRAWVDLVASGVTQRVLAATRADVLVVALRREVGPAVPCQVGTSPEAQPL